MLNRKRVHTIGSRIAALVFIAVIESVGVYSVARATPIGPGFDLFHTPAGGTTTVDINGPAPGGTVVLQGRPLDVPNLGDTDTIVQRLAGIDPLPVGGTGTVPIQIVALSLESVAPVSIGGSFFNVFVHLTPAPQSLGSLTVVHGVPNGGTFNAILPVSAEVTFTEVGNPSDTFADSFFDIFVTLNPDSPWSHTPRPDDPHNTSFPAGDFFPGVDPITGAKVLTIEQAQFAAHGVLPGQVPEPSTWLLLGSGLAGLILWRKRAIPL